MEGNPRPEVQVTPLYITEQDNSGGGQTELKEEMETELKLLLWKIMIMKFRLSHCTLLQNNRNEND